MNADDAAAQLERLQAAASSLRHDLRSILSPALLVADRLLSHPDPAVVRAGELVVRSVNRAEERMREAAGP